jgi:serine protease AprX
VSIPGILRAVAKQFLVPTGLQQFMSTVPGLAEKAKSLSQEVTFTVAPKTKSREPIQAQRGLLAERNIDDFRPHPDSVDQAKRRLTELGFRINRIGRFGISVTGPAELCSEVLKIPLSLQALPGRSTTRATQEFSASQEPPRPASLFVAPKDSLTVKTNISDAIDDVVFIPPPLYFAPSETPPTAKFATIDAAAIRSLLKVPSPATGKGIKVALIDTGFAAHPYYARNGFDYRPTPATQVDNEGHGTGIAYNLFAVAPGATLLGFQRTTPPQDSLEIAAESGADIISCSWGWDYEQSFPILEATIKDIIATDGKIVIFAAGNGEYCWPASMPEVLSVGGVYADPKGNLQASNFASGFNSSLYPGRPVPDISGLCGQKPNGIYIMMPCPAGCRLDTALAGQAFPDKDETQPDDGWFGASGTSSAAPQIAGVAALMCEAALAKGRKLTTADIRNLLQTTAFSVETGRNAQGFPAQGRPNVAVGFGLVDAGRAIASV